MPNCSAPCQWPRHITHHSGHVASPNLPAHEFPARPAGSSRRCFAHTHRDSASPSLKYCAAVQLCQYGTGPAPVLASRCCCTRTSRPALPPLFSSELAVANSHSVHATARPATIEQRDWSAGKFHKLHTEQSTRLLLPGLCQYLGANMTVVAIFIYLLARKVG